MADDERVPRYVDRHFDPVSHLPDSSRFSATFNIRDELVADVIQLGRSRHLLWETVVQTDGAIQFTFYAGQEADLYELRAELEKMDKSGDY